MRSMQRLGQVSSGLPGWVGAVSFDGGELGQF